MSRPTVVGLEPWLPWPLCRWRAWTEPVRAERLAALRIGVSALLLLDVLLTYLPHLFDFFGPNSLGAYEVFSWRFKEPRWYWSIFQVSEKPAVLRAAMVLWIVAVYLLLIGWQTRLSAVVTWVLSSSFANSNPYIDNAGDSIRGIILFLLMFCPCGAAWSVDTWLKRRRGTVTGTVLVYPWPIRLLFVQLCFIYFMNGLYKLGGREWQEGSSLYYVLADMTLSRWSYAQFPVPYLLTRLLSWSVLAWEFLFPVFVAVRWTRRTALVFGVLFHLGIGTSMVLGSFALYAICLYLPLFPWGEVADRCRARRDRRTFPTTDDGTCHNPG